MHILSCTCVCDMPFDPLSLTLSLSLPPPPPFVQKYKSVRVSESTTAERGGEGARYQCYERSVARPLLCADPLGRHPSDTRLEHHWDAGGWGADGGTLGVVAPLNRFLFSFCLSIHNCHQHAAPFCQHHLLSILHKDDHRVTTTPQKTLSLSRFFFFALSLLFTQPIPPPQSQIPH